MSKVAVVQFQASTDKNENLKRIVLYIKQASRRGADLVAFPEFMMIRRRHASKKLPPLQKPRVINLYTFYEKVPGRKNRGYSDPYKISLHLYDATAKISWFSIGKNGNDGVL